MPLDNISEFFRLFRGNPAAHYVRSEDGKYSAVDRGIEPADIERHLRGEYPSVLSIPIDHQNRSFFGVIDVDRHGDEPALDHAALAQRVTELGLPFVVTRSRGGKGAWLILFVKEDEGVPAAIVRKVLTHYVRKLGFTEHIDIYPHQDELGPEQRGNGINLPHFGTERSAFGPDGKELNLDQFLDLAQKRAAYVGLVAQRELIEPLEQKTGSKDQPLPLNVIREIYRKNLENLKSCPPGGRNEALNVAVFFAARAFAANALDRTEKEIKDELYASAKAAGMSDFGDGVNATMRSGWSRGVKQPLQVVDLDKERAEAFERLKNEAVAKSTTREIEEILRDLVRLQPIEYEQVRTGVAAALHIRPRGLDDEVQKRRPRVEKDSGLSGSNPNLDDLEPWPEPVDGVALLDEMRAVFTRYLYFNRGSDAVTAVLWSMLTHCRDRFRISPYLRISSPMEACGKTTMLRILSTLVYRPLSGANVTSAVVFRVVDLLRPTLLIDELDTYLDADPQFIGILNSGHEKKMAHVFRCVGEDQEVRSFTTWGPKAYGMIGAPKGPYERIDDFDEDEPDVAKLLDRLHRQCARWAKDHEEQLRTHRPDVAKLGNRARDNWWPLLVIAELVGGEWPARAHEASALDDPTATESEERILLRDLRNIFHSRRGDWVSSRDLVSDLRMQTSSPWANHGVRKDGINEHTLGVMLKRFGIEHNRKRVTQPGINGDRSGLQWGYSRHQFKELFERLLDDQPLDVETSDDI